MRRHRKLEALLAQVVPGSIPVVRYGVGDYYEDKEPQRKFMISAVARSDIADLGLEIVSGPRAGKKKVAALLEATGATISSIRSERLERRTTR